jgi:lipopolysaccharide transport system permease protein
MEIFKKEIYYYFEVLYILIYKEWIVKYKRTILGFFWSIAYPLLLAIVFYISFKVTLKIPIKNYSLFLLPGVFMWQWFSNTTLVSIWSFIANASIIKKLPIPKWIIPLANASLDMIHFILSIPIILVLNILITSNFPNPLTLILSLPILLILQLILNYSIALVFATFNVFLRDIDRLVTLLINFLIFLTPIFYSLESIPKNLVIYFYLNPLTPFVELWRALLLKGQISLSMFLIALIHTIVLALLATFVYKKLGDKIPEYL